jgi:hypothetical protein
MKYTTYSVEVINMKPIKKLLSLSEWKDCPYHFWDDRTEHNCKLKSGECYFSDGSKCPLPNISAEVR